MAPARPAGRPRPGQRGRVAGLKRLRTFESLGFREFRLLWLGQLGSAMTHWMDQVTRGWLMYDLTGSPAQLGLVTMVQVVPLLLLSPIAGSATDRWGRKTQLIASSALNVVPSALLAVLVITGRVEPWHLYATGLISAALQVFQVPARGALVPEAVEASRLTNAIGLASIAFNVSRSVGPAVAGGLIAAVGAGGSYLVQAVVHAITTVLTMMLRLPDHPPSDDARPAAQPASFLASILEGWRYIAGHPTIRTAMSIAAVAQLLGMSFTTLLPVFARDVLDVGPAGQGFLLTAQGIGALVSAFLIATIGDRMPRGKLVAAGVTAYGVLEVLFSQSRWFWLSVSLMVLLGVCHVSANALVQTIVQGYSSAPMQGRVVAVFQQNQAIYVLGGLMAGGAATLWGAPITVTVMGLGCALGAVTILVVVPHVRQIR